MFELTFSDSTTGTLKLAKAVMQQGPDSFSPLAEGSPEDVLTLALDLDTGDLSDIETDMSARRRLYDELFSHFPGEVTAVIMDINRQTMARLREIKNKPERLRMWVCPSDPSELCGLYFVCHLFEGGDADLSVVRIPAEFVKHPKIILYRSTGEISVEDFEALSEYDEPLSAQQRELYAGNWRALASENAPLRAVLNGRVVGVPEDFYDFALQANIPGGEFRAAQLLGTALEQIPGVSDSWLYRRLRRMIEKGELIEVAPPQADYPYSGILKRGK